MKAFDQEPYGEFDGRGITPAQLGELTKLFLAHLGARSHAEGCAMMGQHPGWHFGQLLDRLGSYTCDWTESNLGYPNAYKGLRPVEEQIQLVAGHFNLDGGPALKLLSSGLPDIPKWSEGWAAFPIMELLEGSYVDLVEDALTWHSGVCGNRPNCYHSSGAPEGLLLPEHVRPHFVGKERKKVSYPRRKFASEWEGHVGGSIMIAPVQMGMLRRGQSDRMVRAYCEKEGHSEFPLGIFEVACLLAMHPTRVPVYREVALNVNAPGDEYTHEGFLKTPNCETKQMGQFWQTGNKGIPCFAFGGDNTRNERNGPITASSWKIRKT